MSWVNLCCFSLVRERADRELREKEKIRSDLEKAEKLKTQLAAEVDEHHSAIEYTNNLNLRYFIPQVTPVVPFSFSPSTKMYTII